MDRTAGKRGRFVAERMVCVRGKAVLTDLYSAVRKLPDSGFSCCWCVLCMSYCSLNISGIRGRKWDGKIHYKPVIIKIVVQIV